MKRAEISIVHVTDIDCRLEPYDWAFAREEAARIDAHWAARCRAKPGLFDGRVLLMQPPTFDEGWLRSACFETGYKSFLSWREFGSPGAPVANCFGMAALRSADGAFMLGEMNVSTASAGRLYFPAGTPEPSDIGADGRVDFEVNVRRELEEETGLRADDVTLGVGWTVVLGGPTVACMKLVQSDATVAELQSRLEAFNATQNDPELVSLVPVRSRSEFDGDRMPPFMLRYLDWALEARGAYPR